MGKIRVSLGCLHHRRIIPLIVLYDIRCLVIAVESGHMVSEETKYVCVVTCNRRIARVFDFPACRIQFCPGGGNRGDACFLKDCLIVEKRKYIRLIRNGLKGSSSHLAAGFHQACIGSCVIISCLGQFFQIHQVGAPCSIHTVNILVKQVNVGSRIQGRL